MRGLRLLSLFTVLVAGSIRPSAGDLGSWEPFGDTGISIRFAQVNRTNCTWAFRNDSNRALKAFSFRIDDVNAESGQAEHSTDLIPYTLPPGQSIGGWTAFSADANCGTVRITTTDIQWK